VAADGLPCRDGDRVPGVDRSDLPKRRGRSRRARWCRCGQDLLGGACLGAGAGPPEALRRLALAVGGAGEDGEQVAEPVQVGKCVWVDRLNARERDGAALGAAADGASEVEARGGFGAAGEQTRPQRLLAVGELGAERVECRDLAVRDAEPRPSIVGSRCGEVGAQVEELALDLASALRR
jgi:hypothetical protein